MQYTLPDLMYDVNLLSIHYSFISSPDFQGINHLTRSLSGCPHFPIMYPDIIDGTTIHDLRQEVSPSEFHSQHISNGLVDFVDGG